MFCRKLLPRWHEYANDWYFGDVVLRAIGTKWRLDSCPPSWFVSSWFVSSWFVSLSSWFVSPRTNYNQFIINIHHTHVNTVTKLASNHKLLGYSHLVDCWQHLHVIFILKVICASAIVIWLLPHLLLNSSSIDKNLFVSPTHALVNSFEFFLTLILKVTGVAIRDELYWRRLKLPNV